MYESWQDSIMPALPTYFAPNFSCGNEYFSFSFCNFYTLYPWLLFLFLLLAQDIFCSFKRDGGGRHLCLSLGEISHLSSLMIGTGCEFSFFFLF